MLISWEYAGRQANVVSYSPEEQNGKSYSRHHSSLFDKWILTLRERQRRRRRRQLGLTTSTDILEGLESEGWEETSRKKISMGSLLYLSLLRINNLFPMPKCNVCMDRFQYQYCINFTEIFWDGERIRGTRFYLCNFAPLLEYTTAAGRSSWNMEIGLQC